MIRVLQDFDERQTEHSAVVITHFGSCIGGLAAQDAKVDENMASSTDPGKSEINLLLPQSATRPLWKHLLGELRDHFFPEKLPPLHVTSRPVNLGMLLGDYVTLPWYRTIFTNIGNVITPEVQAPLELESRPVDVGELINDQLSHPWWTSLLRNLADRVAPEQMAPLELTSKPLDASMRTGSVEVQRWSSVIALPKVPPAQRAEFRTAPVKVTVPRAPIQVPMPAIAGGSPELQSRSFLADDRGDKLRTALSRSRIRQGLLIAIAMAEAVYLIASGFGLI
jgi:hypothetical protein